MYEQIEGRAEMLSGVSNQLVDRGSRIWRLFARKHFFHPAAVLLQQLQDAFTESLPNLAPEEQRELDALTYLSDDALWTIAREQMPPQRQTRLHALMEANSRGTLDDAQRAELETLVAQGQRLSLRKAQAAALLTERGYRVTREAIAAADE